MEDTKRKPLWFIFPGSITKCEGAGRALMKIPVFAATIQRAAAILRPFSIDLAWILTEAPEAAFEDVTNAMVSIIVIQVALVDVLRAMGLCPDGMFGTSLGELGAAYADETLTLEQTVLAAYWRGRCMMEANIPVGPKAVIYITPDQFKKRCPPDIDIFFFYEDRIAVAGPDSSVKELVDTMTSEGIVAKIFGSSYLQFHTRYVEGAAADARKYFESIINNPKSHSSKWISTSLPQDKWNSDIGSLINAEFLVNNIRAPVDMATPIHAMPNNAILLEITVNPQMIRYIKQSLPATMTTVELDCKEPSDIVDNLFEAIKKIYEETGQQLPLEQVSALFGRA